MGFVAYKVELVQTSAWMLQCVMVLILLCSNKWILTHIIPPKTTIYYTQKCTNEYNKLLSLMVKNVYSW